MTSTDVIDVESIPPVGRSDAQDLAATEYDRLVEQLRALDGDDWRQPTDCPLWDVRAIAGHSVGMLSDFNRRFASGTPSLRRCTQLQVEGDVTFGAGVVIEGAVRISGPRHVADGEVLRG